MRYNAPRTTVGSQLYDENPLDFGSAFGNLKNDAALAFQVQADHRRVRRGPSAWRTAAGVR